METGLESKILENFNSFAKKRSILSIVFFSDQVLISWRLPDENVWSEVIALPFSTSNVSVDQIHRVKKYTEAYNIGQNQAYVGIASREYALVPNDLYSPAKKLDYLVKNSGINPLELGTVLSSPCEAINSVFVFHVPSVLDHFLNNHFPGMHLMHEKQSIISGVLAKPEAKGKFLAVNFSGKHFDIIVAENKKLKFFNSFQLISSEDVLYYILFVTEKLESSTRDYVIKIFGSIPDIIDKEHLLKYLPIAGDFTAEDEFFSLKKLPECGL